MEEVESEVKPPSTQNTEYEDVFDFLISLINRSKQIIDKLWNGVYNEINCAIPLKDLPSKCKILRDRYISLRQDILKKPASGSSVVSKKPKWKY